MSSRNAAIRVAVVEDRTQDRDTLVELLRSAPGLECVAVCRSGTEALEMLPQSEPDIILMDIQLPGVSGIDCVRQLQPVLPNTQMMMLTVIEDHDLIFRALAAGATGYLLKKTAPEKLLEAIRELNDGGAPMSGQIARQVVSTFRQGPTPVVEPAILSPVEQSVLQLLARGHLYKEVAEELGLSASTVRTHVWHIYRKLHVHNRTEAVLKGLSKTHPGAFNRRERSGSGF